MNGDPAFEEEWDWDAQIIHTFGCLPFPKPPTLVSFAAIEALEARRNAIITKIMDGCSLVPNDLVEGDCWVWQGPCSGTGRGGGYPRMSLEGKTVAVHRAMFIAFGGPVPSKKQLDHKCRRRMCCNPAHLELVTQKKNCKRRDAARMEVEK